MSTNGNGHQDFNLFRTQPMYTYAEAAHLAQVSTSTVRNWLLGYTGVSGAVPPLFATHDRDTAMVSFLNLIEIVVAAQFRKAIGIKYQIVRRAYENAKEIFSLEYPFAHLQLEAIGGHIVQRYRGLPPSASMRSMDAPDQWTLGLPLPEEVLRTIKQIFYSLDDDLASKWFPIGKDIPIVIDPLVSAGIPTVTGSGVTIPAIHRRFKAGNSIDFISRDYQLDKDVIETAIRYADLVAA